MATIRLLYVFRYFPIYSETFNIREVLALKRKGFAIAICALERAREKTIHREARSLLREVQYLPGFARLSRGSDEDLLLAAANWVAERAVAHGADLLHAHFVNFPAAVARLASHATGIPYSATAHAMDIYFGNPDLEWNLEKAALIVAAHRLDARFLARRFPRLRARVRYAPSSLDLRRFPAPAPGRASFPGALRLLVVSRLHPMKGVGFFLEACARLAARGVAFRAEIAGDGEEEARLRARAAALGLTGAVRFLGALTQEQLRSRYRKCDVVVQPSVDLRDGQFDNLPNTVLEAMAMRRPVIATRVGAVAEAVRDGVNGLLVPHSDPEALMRAIVRLQKDPRLAARLAARGRRTVEERYDIDRSPLAGLLAAAARKTGR